MSASKKLRALNRARIEHDKSRLMAGFAESRKEMVSMVDDALASKVEQLMQQLTDSQKREVMLRDELNTIYKLVPDLVVLMKPSALAATEPK